MVVLMKNANGSKLDAMDFHRFELEHGRFRDSYYVHVQFLIECLKLGFDDINIILFIFGVLAQKYGVNFNTRTKNEFQEYIATGKVWIEIS